MPDILDLVFAAAQLQVEGNFEGCERSGEEWPLTGRISKRKWIGVEQVKISCKMDHTS